MDTAGLAMVALCFAHGGRSMPAKGVQRWVALGCGVAEGRERQLGYPTKWGSRPNAAY